MRRDKEASLGMAISNINEHFETGWTILKISLTKLKYIVTWFFSF